MKKSPARFLCVILAIALLLTALPITVYAEGGTVLSVSTADELTAACTEINTKGGKYTIELKADIAGGYIGITNGDADVTVIAYGADRTIFNNITAVYAENGAKITLGGGQYGLMFKANDVVTTDPGEAVDYPGLIHVLSGSTCVMNDKVTLKDRKSNNYLGGGVSIQGGTFIMNGGTIENCGIEGGSVCYGGGVSVFNGGDFVMNGGTIKDCYVYSSYVNKDIQDQKTAMGGGVFVAAGSEFTMNGGTITNNTATNFGGGIAMTISNAELINVSEGMGDLDIGNPISKVTINGGVISGNKAKNAAGVFASGIYYAYAGRFKIEPLETGLPDDPGLYINGGEISSNQATDFGGGVMVVGLKDPKIAQIKNAQIINNTAAKGAGICVYGYWTKALVENCRVLNNTASTLGGGIYLEENKDEGACTTIKNSVVQENTAGEKGGGVYYTKQSVLNIEGSNNIQENTVNNKDNNLYFQGTEFPVNVTGSLEGSSIGITDAKLFEDDLEDYDPEAQSSAFLTEGFKAQNPDLIPKNAFTSDHESWVVDSGEKSTTVRKTYKYSAKKYLTIPELTEGSLIKQSGNSYYVEFDTDELGEELEIHAGPIYYAICNRFVQNYGQSQDMPLYYQNMYLDDIPVFHDTRSGYYIGVIWANEWNVIIQVGTSYSAIQEYYDYDISLIQCAGNVQTLNGGKPGKIVMKLSVYSPYRDPYIPNYSSEYTEIEIEYDEPITADKTEYYANDIGVVSAKADVDKSSETEISHEIVNFDYTDEVRLVHRTTVDYHINNAEIAANYPGSDDSEKDIFTEEVEKAIGKEVKVGDPINSFYLIPEAKTSSTNSCPYIFKGWYYDKDNKNDSRPVVFGTDHYSKDIYAHWIKVNDVDKDENDKNALPEGYTQYGGFDLAGVQIRKEMHDHNFEDVLKKPGGLRFITSLSMDVVNKIKAIRNDNSNIEYGYVAAANEGWINYHQSKNHKLQYVSANTNGVDTSANATNDNYFDFATNVVCTSRQINRTNNVVEADHQNYKDYLLYSLVITYEGEEANHIKNVLARPYIKYTDANNLVRVAYSDYRGTNVIGGCCTSYDAVLAMQ